MTAIVPTSSASVPAATAASQRLRRRPGGVELAGVDAPAIGTNVTDVRAVDSAAKGPPSSRCTSWQKAFGVLPSGNRVH
ncbi:MAG TPA: hypothetical protein VIK97_04575 [Casimicrobiaceae bacterium]